MPTPGTLQTANLPRCTTSARRLSVATLLRPATANPRHRFKCLVCHTTPQWTRWRTSPSTHLQAHSPHHRTHLRSFHSTQTSCSSPSLESLNKVYGNPSDVTSEPQSIGDWVDVFTRLNTSSHDLFNDLDASGIDPLSTELMPTTAKGYPGHSDMPVSAGHDDLDFGNNMNSLGFRSSPTTMTDGLSDMQYHQAMTAYANQGIQRAGMAFGGGQDNFYTS